LKYKKYKIRYTFFQILILIGLPLVSIALGYLVTSGYSIEMQHFVSPRPSRLSIENFSSPHLHPVMIVIGKAYQKIEFNSSTPLIFHRPPYKSGNINCWLSGTLYLCNGTGYIYKYIGQQQEILNEGEITKFYYSGATGGDTLVILYGAAFSYFILVIIAPLTFILLSYLITKNIYSPIIYVFYIILSIFFIYLGGVLGINVVPSILNNLRHYLFTLLYYLIAEDIIIMTLFILHKASRKIESTSL